MKLRNLTVGQQFKFVTGTNQSTYQITAVSPVLKYRTLNGNIEYKAAINSRLNRDVKVINDTALPAEITFTDGDGDRVKITTETETDFIHILSNYTNPGTDQINTTTVALNKEQTNSLVNFLQSWIAIKD
jgi:hypothetical protein